MTDPKIPNEFCMAGEDHPICMTVGELKAQLKRLPEGLPISQGFGNGVRLVVYNVSLGEPSLSFGDASHD